MNRDPITELLKLDDTLKGLSDGLQAARAYTDERWSDHATRVARQLAQAGHPFTVDDLKRHGVPDPEKHHQWGALMAGLAKQHIIELHGLALHRTRGGNISAVRQWIAGPQAQEKAA